MMELLCQLNNGKVSGDEWRSKLRELSEQIPDAEIRSAMSVLQRMIHNPSDPDSIPAGDEPPGAHGLLHELVVRAMSSVERE